jgi:hypothetical protein
MSAARPPYARYRDVVAQLIEGGEPFGHVEDTIEEFADVSVDDKAALWLLAFSLCARSGRRRDARAQLVAVPEPRTAT